MAGLPPTRAGAAAPLPRTTTAGGTAPARNATTTRAAGPLDVFSGKGWEEDLKKDMVAGGIQALEEIKTFPYDERGEKSVSELDPRIVNELKQKYAGQMQALLNQNLSPEQMEQAIMGMLHKYIGDLIYEKKQSDNFFYFVLGMMQQYRDKVKEAIQGT